MDFWDRIEHVRAHHDVLRHPFYVRWSAGELARDELVRYAGEYRHAVVALADVAAMAAEQARRHEPGLAAVLDKHAREEADHVTLWDGFAQAVGADSVTVPLPETTKCASAWAGPASRPLLDSLVAMYTIEAAQPAISQTKRVGLTRHYGLVAPTATAYFDVHVERDVEHAAAGRLMIDERLADADEACLLAEAEIVLRANWTLLDGVERA